MDCDLLTDDELDKEMIFLGVVLGVVMGISLGAVVAIGAAVFGGD